MSSEAILVPGRPRWQSYAYTVLAGLFALQGLLMGFVVIGPAPWRAADASQPWLTSWHTAQSAVALAVFTGMALTYTLWQTASKAALLQSAAGFVLLIGIPVAALRTGTLGVEIASWVAFVAFGALLLLYPSPGDLLNVQRRAPVNRPLAVVIAVGAVALMFDVWRNLQWQVNAVGGESASHYIWVEAALFDVALLGVGVLVVLRRPGWRALAGLLALACAYLGVVALSTPNEKGSWGPAGGVLALFVAAACAVSGVWGKPNASSESSRH